MKSSRIINFIAILWFFLGFSYYPKWEKPWSEATISWDVSGYYHYLPAIFIYKDIRQQNWMNDINQKYLPSPAYDQAFGHQNSGNKVNKYAIGQAVLFSPFFLMAHGYTTLTGAYPADGYSKPYQFFIWFGSLAFSILGLVLLRRILLYYFEDNIVTWTLVALAAGTHWMEYASITNGMNHTWLFTLLCVLILSTIRFYKKADWTSVVGIGASLGLAVLTRPTEIIWTLIPVLWGISSIKERFTFLLSHWMKCAVAVIISGLIVFIQLSYWKYASGEWIVYSYGDQGFNFLHPAIKRGLIGANIGWWLYTPLMLLAMPGWYLVYKKHRAIFWPTFITTILAIYITLSWSHFESGGGLGQRNLIQIYPLMAFPLASVIYWFNKSSIGKWIWIAILALNIYYTGWWIHQAHKGGFFQAGQMTRAYFLNVVGRINPDRDLFKLLETNEYFKGTPQTVNTVFQNDFEQDTAYCSTAWPSGGKATCLNGEIQFFGPITLPITSDCAPWIRVEADFLVQSREWDV
ncbi:MAG: hypothetical protein IPP25_20375 [Saprospiraceae bacterium]|nr:hypothetical protein [Candidatus Opimibacter skivensis]